MLKKQPILYDPQEDHRYIQSDLDAEMNGQQAAAQLARTASHPITSDGNLQSMLQLEATSKGNDAIIAGRQQSNQRLREMQEQAWQQEVANHTSRYNTAMKIENLSIILLMKIKLQKQRILIRNLLYGMLWLRRKNLRINLITSK